MKWWRTEGVSSSASPKSSSVICSGTCIRECHCVTTTQLQCWAAYKLVPTAICILMDGNGQKVHETSEHAVDPSAQHLIARPSSGCLESCCIRCLAGLQVCGPPRHRADAEVKD